MQKILTAEEMREVDRLTTEKYGIPSLLLMENAAHAAARVITEKLGGSVKGKSVLVLCGKGNNGGDGAALARLLWTQGATVQIFLFGKVDETSGDARANFEILRNIDGSADVMEFAVGVHLYLTEIEAETEWYEVYSGFNQEDVIIDALFGTGLSREIVGNAVGAIETFNYWRDSKYNPLIVSLDIPSGLNSNLTEPIGENFEADLTITFTTPKLANVFPPASNFNGELVVANIGSPRELVENSPSKLFLAEKGDAQSWLNESKFKSDSYKKTRGTALIIAGSENYSGAAVLSANACFAAGAGMVTVAVPKEIHQIVAAKALDEVIVKPLENVNVLKEEIDVIALGCGLASDKRTHKFIRETVENRKTPLVLDAEAMNALSPFTLEGSDDFPLILTPHIGEFTRLLGREVGENKVEEVREFAQKHNVILVLKGQRSLIGKPDGTVVINPTGNAGISRAGAGDTLTGIITSFLAQTFAVKETNLDNAFEAVISALYLAGLAGEIAAEKFSERLLTATDVRNCIREAIEKINQ